MQKLLAFFLAMLLSVSVIAGCGSNSPKTNDKQTTQTTNVNTTKSNNGQNTAANVKANSSKIKISESAAYTDKEHVAAYINEYKRLPHNYITKNEAKKLGWQTKGTLDKKNGRNWKECDIDYVKGNRNAKRIVFSNDGLIYYTGDHYKSFSKLYGK